MKARNQRVSGQAKGSRVVTGIAWYRAEQWPQLLEVAADRTELERTYDEWQAVAKTALVDVARAGVSARKVEVDVNELVAWCHSQGRPVDAAARSAFAALKLRQAEKEEQK